MIHLFYQGLILRITGAAALSFGIVILLGPKVIRFLMKSHLGDRPEFNHADLNELSQHKSNTPTMGGILIVIAIFFSIIVFADLSNMYIRLALFTLVWLGLLGAADDWIKIRHNAGKGDRDGLKSWEKLCFQIALGVLMGLFMRSYGEKIEESNSLYIPFTTLSISLAGAGLLFVLIAVLTMVGTSNAVNLTDGMDGLAAGCICIVTIVYMILSWIAGVQEWAGVFRVPMIPKAAEMTVICASMLGATLGFLWYNSHPAQVFMGDTGSLALGGLLGIIALVIRQELLLIVAGGVFVMETLSVMLQVSYFKMTRPGPSMPGKRLFRCAPIHHHFHLGGWAETKVVIRFWLLSIVFAALALASLKLKIRF